MHELGDLSYARIYGILGSVLLLLDAAIPRVGSLVTLIGLILLLLAVKNISEAVEDEFVYKNFLIAFVAMFLNSIATIIIKSSIISPESIKSGAVLSGIAASLAFLWAFLLIGTFFLRKSYILIGEYTNVQMFKFTGTLYLIGAALLIIVIGGVVIFIAEILQVISFFSLPESPVTKKYPKNSS